MIKRNNLIYLGLILIVLIITIITLYFIYFQKKERYYSNIQVIPDAIPGTQSWLYMPLIYYILGHPVNFPEGFFYYFDNAIKKSNNELGEIGMTLPFNNLEEFKLITASNATQFGINSINDIARGVGGFNFDGDYHIPQDQQERLIQYDISLEVFLKNLVELLTSNPNPYISDPRGQPIVIA